MYYHKFLFVLLISIGYVKAQRLMVVGGQPTFYQVEVLDLSGNNRHCRNLTNSLSDEAGVGTFMNGEAIVCNSYERRDTPGTCYIYDNSTDTWLPGPTTGLPTFESVGVMINNDQEWWISGGNSLTLGDVAETVVYNGTDFRPFENLPHTDYAHHMIAVNDTHIVYLEGYSVLRSGIFDLTTNSWSSFQHLPRDKDFYFAGLATYPDRSRHIVVAGGIYDTSTWIYDLDSGIDIWRPGPELVYGNGPSVQFGDTFLAIGGRHNVSPLDPTDLIWQFNADPTNETWIQRSERLEAPKFMMAAFMIPDDYVTC